MCHSVFLFKIGDLKGSPQWWHNFLDHNMNRYVFSRERINLALMDYSAQFVRLKHSRYIDFYDEQAYAWFLLRWS
jgi:hypothetical protein